DHPGSGTPLERLRLIAGEPGGPCDVAITATLGMLTRMRRRELDLEAAEKGGLRVAGDEAARSELALLMGWPPATGPRGGNPGQRSPVSGPR
ncbi:MAG: hypothetical protein KDB24_00390, partial [Microthrixaceae bacterium]|nr:hypothetical protein [Microthrixaceae bacterium]